MTIDAHIPPELLQYLTSREAWDYRLIPFDERDGTLLCYGERDREYETVSIELEVLFGKPVRVETIDCDEFIRLLKQCYRCDVSVPLSGSGEKRMTPSVLIFCMN